MKKPSLEEFNDHRISARLRCLMGKPGTGHAPEGCQVCQWLERYPRQGPSRQSRLGLRLKSCPVCGREPVIAAAAPGGEMAPRTLWSIRCASDERRASAATTSHVISAYAKTRATVVKRWNGQLS